MRIAAGNIGIVLRHPSMLFARMQKRKLNLGIIDVSCVECAAAPHQDRGLLFSRSTAEPPGMMSRETFSMVARRVLPFCDSVHFTGCGEPLLNEDLPWMIRVVKTYGREAHLTTNGILLDEEKICEIIGTGVDSLAVFLYGATPHTHDGYNGKGSFDRTVGNLGILKKVKRKMGLDVPLLIIDTIITEGNLDEITEILELARDLGAAGATLSPREGNSGAPAEKNIVERERMIQHYYDKWGEKAGSLGLRLRFPGESAAGDGEGRFPDADRRVTIAWDGEVSHDVFSSA